MIGRRNGGGSDAGEPNDYLDIKFIEALELRQRIGEGSRLRSGCRLVGADMIAR